MALIILDPKESTSTPSGNTSTVNDGNQDQTLKVLGEDNERDLKLLEDGKRYTPEACGVSQDQLLNPDDYQLRSDPTLASSDKNLVSVINKLYYKVGESNINLLNTNGDNLTYNRIGDKIYIPVELNSETEFNPLLDSGFVSFFIGNVETYNENEPSVDFGDEQIYLRTYLSSSEGKAEDEMINGTDVWDQLIYLTVNENISGLLKDVWGKQVIAWYSPNFAESLTLLNGTRGSSIEPEEDTDNVDRIEDIYEDQYWVTDDSKDNIIISSSGEGASLELTTLTEDRAFNVTIIATSSAKESVYILGVEYLTGSEISLIYLQSSDTYTATLLSPIVIDDYSDVTVKVASNIEYATLEVWSNGFIKMPEVVSGVLDGITLTKGDLFLVKDQSDKTLNGLFSYISYTTTYSYGTKVALVPDLHTIRVSEGTQKGMWQSIYDGDSDASKVFERLSDKQETLISGTNIKTINSESIVGSGDIIVETPYIETTVNLTSSGWTTSLQSETITGLTATSDVIIYAPQDYTHFTKYGASKISATSLGTNTITFTCTDTPSEDIDNVIVKWRN